MRKTKTKFRWLALLLAMVSMFGVLAIPASADYYNSQRNHYNAVRAGARRFRVSSEK